MCPCPQCHLAVQWCRRWQTYHFIKSFCTAGPTSWLQIPETIEWGLGGGKWTSLHNRAQMVVATILKNHGRADAQIRMEG